MHPYAIINFHELCPAARCDVIVSKFHQPIEHTADEIINTVSID